MNYGAPTLVEASEQGAIDLSPQRRPQEASLFPQDSSRVPRLAAQTGLGEAGWWDTLGVPSLNLPLLGSPGREPSPHWLVIKGCFYSCARHHQSCWNQHPWPLESSCFSKSTYSPVLSTPRTAFLSQTYVPCRQERKDGGNKIPSRLEWATGTLFWAEDRGQDERLDRRWIFSPQTLEEEGVSQAGRRV